MMKKVCLVLIGYLICNGLLSGCAVIATSTGLYSTTALGEPDLSPESRHEAWIKGVKGIVGEKEADVFAFFSKKSGHWPLIHKEKNLPDGNLENKYEYLFTPRNGVCHLFYEYDPKTRLVVSFRFEESYQYACRARAI